MTGLSKESYVDVKMGESDHAMEYDQELIFRHLCVHFEYLSNDLLFTLLEDASISTLPRMRINMA
jgi:hypothetical protein